MEDNEFEEVSIVSHTDSTLISADLSNVQLRYKGEQVKIEVLMTISASNEETQEVVKPEADDPRLAPGLRELEKLKQDHFGEGKLISKNSDIHFISRVAGESGQYLLGAGSAVTLSDGQRSTKQFCGAAIVDIIYWGDYALMFTMFEGYFVFNYRT